MRIPKWPQKPCNSAHLHSSSEKYTQTRERYHYTLIETHNPSAGETAGSAEQCGPLGNSLAISHRVKGTPCNSANPTLGFNQKK